MATAFPIYGDSSGAFSIITGFFYNQSAPMGHPQILATLPGKDYIVSALRSFQLAISMFFLVLDNNITTHNKTARLSPGCKYQFVKFLFLILVNPHLIERPPYKHQRNQQEYDTGIRSKIPERFRNRYLHCQQAKQRREFDNRVQRHR